MKSNQNDFLNKPLVMPTEKEQAHLEQMDKEFWSYIYVALGCIGFGLVNFHTKYTKHLFEETFDPISFTIFRSIAIGVLGYYFCHKDNIEIVRWNQINNKFWFLVRTIGNYISFFTFVMCVMYFRASTAACINSSFPAVAIFFSILFLNEKFYFRYVIGLLICFTGTLMIIFNERSDPAKITIHSDPLANVDDEHNYMRILYGSIFGVGNIVTVGLLVVSIKIVHNEKICFSSQAVWVGITNTICGIIQICFMGSMKFSIPYFLFSFSNGGLWYLGNFILLQGYKNIAISKTLPLAYLTTVTVFILGVLVLNEPIFFSDVLGSVLILSFNLYNVYLPPK